MSARLDRAQRAAAWEQLQAAQLDVLVVGGGVTGAGTALDAATRGLSVGLVEARDFGSGTSSRSSKLFHGGVRYLEQLELGLVRQALRERDLALRALAPHLVKPVQFLYPLRHRGWERPYIGSGLLLYDALGGGRAVPRHRHLSRRQAHDLSPVLRDSDAVGGLLYHDAQTDDARYTITLVRTAAHHGAIVRSSTEVVGLVREGGRVAGAEVRDVETGATATIRARAVVGCAGVWTDRLAELAGVDHEPRVRASKGVHIVIPRGRIPSSVGIILRTEHSVLFVIPWGSHWIVGTTDTPWELDMAHPAATSRDIDYLLGQLRDQLGVVVPRSDIEGVYVGLRPLLSSGDEATTRVSREHEIEMPVPGLVLVAGGKYTTYRVMARDAVDAAREACGLPAGESITDRVPLLGAADYWVLRNRAARIGEEHGVSTDRVRALLDRYGSLTGEVLAAGAERPELLEPLGERDEYLKVELLYGATHEGALHLDDLLTRRTRMSIESTDSAVPLAPTVAGLVAGALDWDERECADEIALYRDRVAAERASHAELEDDAAESVRLRARDSRMVSRL